MNLLSKSSRIRACFATVFFAARARTGVIRQCHARLPGLLVLLLLGACAAPAREPVPTLAIPDFAGLPAEATGRLPDPSSFLEIDAEMRSFVHEYVAPVPQRLERLRRLTQLMMSPGHLGIRYEEQSTLNAAEVFRRGEANCLSFTALFISLAREAGLDASFQDVPVLPNWRLDGHTFVVERHVNALVRIRNREFVVDLRPPQTVSYARARRIPDRNAIAQYFGNLGVERLTADDAAGAYRLFRRGLEVDESAAALWINLGVALGRNGQLEDAVAAYRHALRLDPENISALSNLAGVAEFRGRSAEAAELLSEIKRHRARNPYYQYWVGERRLLAGEAKEAVAAFRRALRLLPGEADIHFALARALYMLGRAPEAARSLQAALTNARSEGMRERYRTEFEAFRSGG